MIERHFWTMVAAATVATLKPFRATVEQMPHGPRYVCRWYDDAPAHASAAHTTTAASTRSTAAWGFAACAATNANSIDFTWQVRVCRRITPAKRGPKA
jgi:hypothetical protein